ncbi:YopX family protein [Latilactobacillus curvatus]|uniref:YopX family protein n=1 Tax=Latilactobacillus curvatus TaxID=28038 RepID=UPI0009755694|nr:YopX family protein [Latilactobacillus curvatus]
MREIKFRAWDKATREYWNIDKWHFEDEYLDLIEPGTSICDPHIERIWRKRRDVELMQYTGLKDMYGRDIYEGDVVEFEVSLTRTKAEVKYSRNQFIVSMNSVMPRSLDLYLVKIIGNKFENPELLEAE